MLVGHRRCWFRRNGISMVLFRVSNSQSSGSLHEIQMGLMVSVPWMFTASFLVEIFLDKLPVGFENSSAFGHCKFRAEMPAVLDTVPHCPQQLQGFCFTIPDTPFRASGVLSCLLMISGFVASCSFKIGACMGCLTVPLPPGLTLLALALTSVAVLRFVHS
jgi:hypothetical protein